MRRSQPLIRRLPVYLLFLCACAGLCALGLWQLQRAHEKRVRYEVFTERYSAPPIEFDTLAHDTPMADYQWRRTRISGHYLDVHAVLDNRIQNGRAGYEVMTPFVTAGGRTVLVDRGWVPLPGSRDIAPEVLAPSDTLRLTGYIGHEPVVGIELDTDSRAAEIMSPRIFRFQRIELEGLEAVLGADLWPAVIYLDAGEPGAFTVAWQQPGDGSDRHTAYAVQWFTMAAVLAGIGVWNLKRGRRLES